MKNRTRLGWMLCAFLLFSMLLPMLMFNAPTVSANPDASGVGYFTKVIDTPIWDVTGILIGPIGDNLLYISSQATVPGASDAKISKATYTISTNTWSSFTTIYDSSYADLGMGGGIIDNTVFVFLLRRTEPSTYHDIGYIKSTDNGNTWSSFTSIDMSPLTIYYPYGHIVKVENVYYQLFYGDNGNAPYYVKMFKSEDNGASWVIGPAIYSGNNHYTETCAEYIGDNKLIALMRAENTGFKVRQSVSSDGGNTWSTPADTNLGMTTGTKIPFSIYNDSEILLVFAERGNTTIRISKGDALDVFDNFLMWESEKVLREKGSGEIDQGYPSIAKIDSKNYYIVWYVQENASEGDTFGGYWHLPPYWTQTDWFGDKTTPTLQVDNWDATYDNYCQGENENNENKELRLVGSLNLAHDNDSEVGEDTGGDWIKVKSWTTTANGILRIDFDLMNNQNEGLGKIYKNGIPVGTERAGGGSYVTFPENIGGWNIGDNVELWIASAGEGDITYARNFGIYVTYYYLTAYVESSIYDATYANWENVYWNASTPTGTSITVNLRSGNSDNSYDGSWSGWCQYANDAENDDLPNSRYVQYRVDFSTTDNTVTPEFYDITITYKSGFSGGDGTVENPYIITNENQLQAMKYDLSAYYALGNDIDASATHTWNDNGGGGYYGFLPIGTFATNFTGSFDGRGHKISNLYVNAGAEENEAGLFGWESGGVIENVRMENVNIFGGYMVGGLVGYNNGTVSNCYSTGSVSGIISEGYGSDVGGLVGFNFGGTISNSFWDMETSGQSTSDGGTGKTTENMKNVRTYTDNTWSIGLTTPWDFAGNPYEDENNEDIWNIHPLVNDGYPFLTGLLSTLLPMRPQPISPENEANIGDNTPTFIWIVGGGANNHRLLIDNDNDFSLPNENHLFNGVTTTYTIADENSLADGVYYWKVVAINAAGENESDNWWFRIDTLAPTITAFSINSGATYALSTSVTLTIAASDGGSSVENMCFSTDSVNWSAWEAFASTKSYTLSSGDGTKTVYIKTEDAAGNESTAASASIILITPANNAVIDSGSLTLPSGETMIITVVANSGGTAIITPLSVVAMPAPSSYTVLGYVDIFATITGGSTITFGISESWLASNEIDRVVLLRYADGSWQELSTSCTGSSGGYRYYSATTSGFSVFAIAGVAKESPAPMAPPQLPTSNPQEPTNQIHVVIIASVGAIIVFLLILIAPAVKKSPRRRKQGRGS